jgi:integrase
MINERVKIGGRGQGSLVKYDNSPHWVSCFYVHGTEHRVSTGTPDLKVAKRVHKAKLDEVSADRQGLRPFVAPTQARATVAELLVEWEKDVKLRGLKSSYKAIAHSKPIRAYFGSWKAIDVTAEAVDRYVEKLRNEGLAAATCNRRVQCLASAFKLGLTRKRLIHVPTFRKLSEAGNARRGFFERDEIERLVAVLPEHLADLVRFAYLTGWRKAEVVGLRWEMIDVAGGTITLPTTKNGKGRVLALDGPVAEVIRRREAARLTERHGEPVVASHVFHRAARPVGDFKRAWRTALVAAGLPDKLFHDLRRTGVRNMIRRGVPEVVAMSISGHKTRSVFDRYNIVNGEDQRKAMRAVSV